MWWLMACLYAFCKGTMLLWRPGCEVSITTNDSPYGRSKPAAPTQALGHGSFFGTQP